MKSSSFIYLFLIILTGCSQVEIDSEYDKQADFSSYKSFSVCLQDMKIENQSYPDYDNPENRLTIRNAIENEMKDFYSVNDTTPDLRVGFHIQMEKKRIEYRSCINEGKYQTWRECHFETVEHTIGTLIIYVASVRTNQIIWQASVSEIIENGLSYNKNDISKIVKQMFKNFPSKQNLTS